MKDIAQDSGDCEDPVAVRDGQADFVANIGGGIESAALAATGAATASLAGEWRQVMVLGLFTFDSQGIFYDSTDRTDPSDLFYSIGAVPLQFG